MSPSPRSDWVFGYGSLVDGDARPARLRGFARDWGVAMDNAVDLPAYKRYLLPSGERPAVMVCFLDLVAEPGAAVVGAVRRVAGFEALDARERNYERVEVTRALDGAPPGRVWAYVGSPAGRERARRGRVEGRAVVARAYLDGVRAGFARLGSGAPPPEPDVPVWELARIDIP